jgi:hypothetical protein
MFGACISNKSKKMGLPDLSTSFAVWRGTVGPVALHVALILYRDIYSYITCACKQAVFLYAVWGVGAVGVDLSYLSVTNSARYARWRPPILGC